MFSPEVQTEIQLRDAPSTTAERAFLSEALIDKDIQKPASFSGENVVFVQQLSNLVLVELLVQSAAK